MQFFVNGERVEEARDASRSWERLLGLWSILVSSGQ
jgi:hypothetical protein